MRFPAALLAPLLMCLPASAQKPTPPPRDMIARLLADEGGDLTEFARQVLGPEGANQLFFVPTRDKPLDPADLGYRFENVRFPSSDNLKLHGWFFPSPQGARKAKATVVFSHGNTGSVGHHFGFVAWLILEGYNLFMYDYRGYGESEGTPSRQGVVDDVRAAFAYIRTRPDIDPSRLISVGHSLGGTATITALADGPREGLLGVAAFAPFSSYREMAIRLAGNVGGRLVSDELSPKDYVSRLSPVPLLIVHGTADKLIPIAQGAELHVLARDPKTFLKVPGADHIHLASPRNPGIRRQILAWFEEITGR